MGTGGIAAIHAADIARLAPRTRIVAATDVDADRLGEFCARWSVPRWYPDLDALLGNEKPDLVHLCTPPGVHASQAVACLRLGVTVLCEKPPALTLAETAEIAAAVKKTGVFFQMGFMRRFDAGYAAAKKRMDEGAIGTAVVFKSSSRDPRRTSLEYADPKSSGGMILDMGIHDFDLARFFMGEVESVHAVGGTLAYPELKTVGDIDNAIVTLQFTSGLRTSTPAQPSTCLTSACETSSPVPWLMA